MITNKLFELEKIINSAKDRSKDINKEDIEFIESGYKLSNGTIFTLKMITDFKMWKTFEKDYHIDEIGILKLREILGNPEDFIKKYVK